MALDFGRIGILMGGPSSEREISLKSGKAVYKALKQSHIDARVVEIETDKEAENIRLIKSNKIDCAFLALHGQFGEDGQIQKILEEIKIPYTGSGVLASRLAMDKIASRSIFNTFGLKVPRFTVLEKCAYNPNYRLICKLGLPLVIKPANHGSSIGLSIIKSFASLKKSLEYAFSFDQKVIIEEYISGREMTVGILDNAALPIIEIIPKKKFFDYEAKYNSKMTRYIIPAKLDRKIAKQVKLAALSAHLLLGCAGFSRIDMILSNDKIPYILEVNSIPGLTETSLLPKAAKSVGIKFNELCLKLVKLAYEKKKS